jgi:hypothetical protein
MAEGPNKNLHKFRGKAEIRDERLRDVPLSPGAVNGIQGMAGWGGKLQVQPAT